MQQMRQAPDGFHWLCMADGCDQISVLGWARKTDSDGGTTAVEACGDHKLSDDLAARIHEIPCLAPPTCGCGFEP